MKIKTNAGAEYCAKTMFQMVRKGKPQLMIEFEGTDMQHAAQMASAKSIEIPFARLASLTETEAGVRVTLEMEE